MSALSRIFKRVLQLSLPSSLTVYGAVALNTPETKNQDDDEDCETPICHDADEAIKEYEEFMNLNNKNKFIRKHTNKNSFMPPPPDRQQLGRHSWTLLHAMAAYWPNNPSEEEKQSVLMLFDALSKVYPCKICAADLKHELMDHPPQLEDRDQFIQWLCALHNRINKKLRKPAFDCTNHQKRWRKEHNHQKPWRDIQEHEETGHGHVEHD